MAADVQPQLQQILTSADLLWPNEAHFQDAMADVGSALATKSAASRFDTSFAAQCLVGRTLLPTTPQNPQETENTKLIAIYIRFLKTY